MAGYFFAVFFDGSLFSQSYVFQSTFQRFQQSKDPLKDHTTHGFVAKKEPFLQYSLKNVSDRL